MNTRKPQWRAAAVAALILAAATASACAGRSEAPERGPAVELEVPALDGGAIDLERYRGQPVVVHIFIPGEPETAGDVEQLIALEDAGYEDIVVIGVALEPGGYNLVAAWRRGMGVDYLVGMVTEPDEIRSAHIDSLEALPTTLVVDSKGRLTHRVDRPLRGGELFDLVAPFAANDPSERHSPESE